MNLQDDLGITFVVVTHDQEEAMTLSTRIAVMNAGRFEQTGTPGEVYEFPENRFIADFVGNINLLEARVIGLDGDRMRLHCEQTASELEVLSTGNPGASAAAGDTRWVAVRPEKIFISKDAPPEPDRTVLKGTVLDLGYFGNLSVYRVELASGQVLQVSGQNRERTAVRKVEWDDEVFVSWDLSSAILLDK
jgi:putrescine transport system ATP-binding protein